MNPKEWLITMFSIPVVAIIFIIIFTIIIAYQQEKHNQRVMSMLKKKATEQSLLQKNSEINVKGLNNKKPPDD
ncbi:hypothetical protein KJ836_01070 [Patescibacteria group bacterium]|nr:hypothetical protein [Patescibacteria group bacterium]